MALSGRRSRDGQDQQEILRGAEEWCSAHGMAVAVSAVRHGSARPASWTSALASHDTDGGTAHVRWSSPPTTTVRQPLAGMGRVAAEMLGSRVEGLALSSPPDGAGDRTCRAGIDGTAVPGRDCPGEPSSWRRPPCGRLRPNSGGPDM